MADLRIRYLGMELRSPLVASSSPLTGSLDGLRRLEAAGAGAVVLPSLFEEELVEELRQVDALLATGATDTETLTRSATGLDPPPTWRWSPRPSRPCRSRWWPA
jgi:dihydroorotate dehydrogenase (fumarate)